MSQESFSNTKSFVCDRIKIVFFRFFFFCVLTSDVSEEKKEEKKEINKGKCHDFLKANPLFSSQMTQGQRSTMGTSQPRMEKR